MKELYKVETGVLLTKDDEEFENYNHVYTKDFGFFDEDNTFFKNPSEAKQYGIDYVKNGVQRTYAVITSDSYDDTNIDMIGIVDEIICGNEPADSSWNFGFDKTSILYFAYKDNSNIVVVSDLL